MEFEAFLPAPHGQDHPSDMEGPEVPDGMKVDSEGNLYCTGPGGVLIFTPEGRHLGTIQPAEQPSNVAWGDADGKTLYMSGGTDSVLKAPKVVDSFQFGGFPSLQSLKNARNTTPRKVGDHKWKYLIFQQVRTWGTILPKADVVT